MFRVTLYVFIIFFTLLAFDDFAQAPTFKISGKVIDEKSQLPLHKVNVQINGTIQGTMTDTLGEFTLICNETSNTLTFQCIGYEKKIVEVSKDQNVPLIITLLPATRLLKEVVINSSFNEIVFKGKNNNVLDYNFYGDNILLITFGNKLSASKLFLLTPTLDTLSKLDIPDKPVKLFKDCVGNNHIVCFNNVYQVYYDSTRLHLLPAKSIEAFDTVLSSCIAADSDNLYYIQKAGSRTLVMENIRIQTNNHALAYYFVNKSNKQANNLVTIVDKESLTQSADDQHFVRMKEAGGIYRETILKEFDRKFEETILYKEIFAPLYVMNNSVYIFDFVNSKIQRYSSGKLSSEVKIKFQTRNNWKREMCVDHKSEKAYAIFESSGTSELKEINLNNGLLTDSYKIPSTFVENIKVHSNYIYYLYKGNAYGDTKFLSRLRIN